jgi:predicted TIM-barrel fold metal-dependent hydrolase
MLRFPWIHLQRKTDPEQPVETPLLLGNKSNGEFFWEQTPAERRMRAEILRRAEAGARRLGIDRRDFLASALGMATSLAVVNLFSGCSNGGGFKTPEEPLDCTGASQILSGDEFIFDIQTHCIDDKVGWEQQHPGKQYNADGFAQFLTLYQCDLASRPDCIGPAQYARLILIDSDTTMTTLSGFPSPMCDDGTLCTNLNGNDEMASWRDFFNAAAGSQRMVQHCQVAPNDRWDLQQAMMEYVRETYGNHGWKCYPPWGPDGKGWWLDDDAIGTPFIEKCLDLGEPLICIHKGFPLPGFDQEHSDPRDVGPAAVRFPQATFVIYHSAFISQNREGPYDPNGKGVDRLIKTVLENDLKGKNVYAELGSAWVLSMNNALAAQHLIGKLVKYLGEDNVLWGSECLWFGSPQPQIEAFRALQISPELQDQYGYPELTPELKQKILGLNSARVYGVDPGAVRCTIDQSKLGRIGQELDATLGTRRWAFQEPLGPRTRREFVTLQRFRRAHGRMA